VAIAILDRSQDPPDVSGREIVFIDLDAVDRGERAEVWSKVLRVSGVAAPLALEAASMLAARSRAGSGLAVRAVRAQTRVATDRAELVSRIEATLRALVRPSATRGIVVEHPTAPLTRLIVAPDVEVSIHQLLMLAEQYEATDDRGGQHGVKALFVGPSGTGKTLAARVAACHLGRPLYRIDLSAVVSKWIGETEKNLRRSLEAAEAAGAVLLFDEGDALLAKRGEVTRGSDRYANVEAAYLLQAVEAHDGIVIVTTNLRKNLDPAFFRRFDAIIEFPPPDAERRIALWIQELGRAGDGVLDEELKTYLAAAELTGGNIATAARIACARARRRSSATVNAGDIHLAIAREFRKMGLNVQAGQWTERAVRHG
jgi:SpoVK/Ycf46/Vps4 family AAA+-type ATPase